ncbi:MAG: cupin domain-containing protein [Prevotellaceae bacterium]|jgi:transcriptional regulator with XRE-family HTH domain|nr:cupin domain-containing protein [Prevotellaceae bacterium]
MNKQIKQIAERLRGLRDALDLTAESVAEQCGVSLEDYLKYESGKTDIPMSFLFQVAQNFGVELTALLTGDEPRMESYFLTRKGKGTAVERTKTYKYQALAAGFKNAKAEPFEVMVEPNDKPIHLNSHIGQEFNFLLEGTMQLRIGNNDLILEEGDSIYFNSEIPHGMKAIGGKKVRFLAIIL